MERPVSCWESRTKATELRHQPRRLAHSSRESGPALGSQRGSASTGTGQAGGRGRHSLAPWCSHLLSLPASIWVAPGGSATKLGSAKTLSSHAPQARLETAPRSIWAATWAVPHLSACMGYAAGGGGAQHDRADKATRVWQGPDPLTFGTYMCTHTTRLPRTHTSHGGSQWFSHTHPPLPGFMGGQTLGIGSHLQAGRRLNGHHHQQDARGQGQG